MILKVTVQFRFISSAGCVHVCKRSHLCAREVVKADVRVLSG